MANTPADVIRVETADPTTVSLKDKMIAFGTASPYKMVHQYVGTGKIYYTSDTGDRTQTGSITVATGHELHSEVLRALNASGLELQDDSGTAYLTVNDGGTVDIDTDLLLAGGSQDYLVTDRGNALCLQSQTAATVSQIEFYNADGDETDRNQLLIYAKGTPTQSTDISFLRFGYSTSDSAMVLKSEKNSTATLFPIIMEVGGNTKQLCIATGGGVGIGEASPQGKLHVTTSDTAATAQTDGNDFIVETASASGGGMSLLVNAGEICNLYFASSSNTNAGKINYDHTSDTMGFYTNGYERFHLTTAESVFNDIGADVNFRVEGDTNQYALFLDAGTGYGGFSSLGSATWTPDRPFHVEVEDSGTADTVYLARLSRNSSGSSTVGFGAGLEIELEGFYGTQWIATTLECENAYEHATKADYKTFLDVLVDGAPVTIMEWGHTSNGANNTASLQIPIFGAGFLATDANGLVSAKSPVVDYGSLYMHEASQTITISVVDTYVKITGFTTGELSGVSINSDAFNVAETGRYKIDWQLSFSSVSNNQTSEVDIFVNSVNQNDGSSRRKTGTGGDNGSMSGTAIIDITSTGYDIDLRMKNITSTSNFTILNANFNIMRIGD